MKQTPWQTGRRAVAAAAPPLAAALREERLLRNKGWRMPFIKRRPDEPVYSGTGMGTAFRLVSAA